MKNLKVVGERGRNFVRIPREFFKEKGAHLKPFSLGFKFIETCSVRQGRAELNSESGKCQ